MKLTKYQHACIVLEEQGKKLVIDPGGFTSDFGDLRNIAAVVVTHEHGDHFNPDNLQAILAASPEARIFTVVEVAQKFQSPNMKVVKAGDVISVGPFSLKFGGEMHATVNPKFPTIHNTTVLVNEKFYCPGDSYTVPEYPVDVLAVPANAPWAKVSETMDFIAQVKPRLCLPTHNGLLSDNGNAIYNPILKGACESVKGEFTYLKPGESIEI